MNPRKSGSRIHPAWWTAILVVTVVSSIVVCWLVFNRVFTSYAPITLISERGGLGMQSGGVVKLRGVEVGRIGPVVASSGKDPVSIELEIRPDQLRYIPANVDAQITATTAFGEKFVELVPPKRPSSKRLSAGAVLHSRNVATEVNTVFDNLVELLHQIDPAKLNAVLTTFADGLRGRGQKIGEAATAADDVLKALNSRSETIRQDWRSFADFSDTYGAAAQNILATLDAASTTSVTVKDQAKALDSLLLNVIGLSNSGLDLIAPNKANLVHAVNILEPTTNLLYKYNPEYACMLMGAKWYLDNGALKNVGGNGRTLTVDVALLLGNDPYVYPDNLPIVAAKGGPGGKPGCGSLPDASKNFPVRQMVTNTGWGTGMDIRDNIGLGHPCYANYFPVTRAVPEPPSVRCQGPPSPGLVLPAPGPLPLPPSAPPPAQPQSGVTPP